MPRATIAQHCDNLSESNCILKRAAVAAVAASAAGLLSPAVRGPRRKSNFVCTDARTPPIKQRESLYSSTTSGGPKLGKMNCFLYWQIRVRAFAGALGTHIGVDAIWSGVRVLQAGPASRFGGICPFRGALYFVVVLVVVSSLFTSLLHLLYLLARHT